MGTPGLTTDLSPSEEVSLLRRQVGRLNRRVMALELDTQQRANREMIMYTLGVAYFLIKAILWINRNWMTFQQFYDIRFASYSRKNFPPDYCIWCFLKCRGFLLFFTRLNDQFSWSSSSLVQRLCYLLFYCITCGLKKQLILLQWIKSWKKRNGSPLLGKFFQSSACIVGFWVVNIRKGQAFIFISFLVQET